VRRSSLVLLLLTLVLVAPVVPALARDGGPSPDRISGGSGPDRISGDGADVSDQLRDPSVAARV
jgi:hypothetical protein